MQSTVSQHNATWVIMAYICDEAKQTEMTSGA